MSLVLEDAIELITPKSVSELGSQIIEIVQHLENLFKLEDTQIEESELLKFLSKLNEFSERLISNQDFIRQRSVIKEFKTYSKNSRLKYSIFLPKSFFQELESVEIHSEAIIQLTASQFIMLSAALNDDDEVENIKSFYSGLLYTQQVVEKSIAYLPDDIIQSINLLAKKILIRKTKTKSLFKSKEIEQYVMLTKNIAKVITWEITEDKTNSSKKFKNVDELWDYWDKVFDENEMAETSEALIQALNETRENQGKSKLFE